MMGLNYQKWDNLSDYSSSSEDESGKATSETVAATLRLKAMAADDTRPTGLLVTVPWDSHCEAVRWALDRHGISYIEEDYPWGLHIWATLEFSDPMPRAQQTTVPVFKNGKGEVLKRSSTDIFTYLFAHSLSSTIRLYTPPTALDLQSNYDSILAPAARTIFLHAVLSSSDTARRYLLNTPHLAPWRTVARFSWPVVGVIMRRHFDVSADAVEKAWQAVEEVYESVGVQLSTISTFINVKGKKPIPSSHTYLCGSTLTAADIVFASHSTLCLFPNPDHDSFATNVKTLLPPLTALDPRTRDRVLKLRATSAGRHAIRMYRKERGSPSPLATKRSRYARENNPWWCDGENGEDPAGDSGRWYGGSVLTRLVCMAAAAVLGVAVTIVTAFGWILGPVILIAMACGMALGAAWGARGTICETRARQAWFILFGEVEAAPPVVRPPSGKSDAGGAEVEKAKEKIKLEMKRRVESRLAPAREAVEGGKHAM
ncbi:hypothetical protein HKX48_001215 [Thoreauomyces humboldtii]|nr:hypothetical protein HKX48_001215 [Thoreauomyces humboldtii]